MSPHTDYIVAFDQGTTSSRCVVFDRDANIVSSAQEEIKRYFPHPGWVEQDATEIWSSQLGMYFKSLARSGITSADVAGIGVTNQRETTIVWNRHTGEPVYRAIVWQCRRGTPCIDRLIEEGYSDLVREKTGLMPDAYFSASKLRWILDNVPGAREGAEAGDVLFGTVDTWLIWQMTLGKVHATDYTNASRTMLLNIHTLQWDDELLELFDIPRAMLPDLKASDALFGLTEADVQARVPISGVLGDQQSALFAQCCFEKGDTKATYGTGCFVLVNTGDKPALSKNGLLTTIAYTSHRGQDGQGQECERHTGEQGSTVTQVTYALEGSVYSAGSTVQWLRDGLRIIRHVSEVEEMALSLEGNDGVYLVPAFNGLGAPHWNSEAQGVLTGLTQGTTPEHIARAALESTAFQVADVIHAMEEDMGDNIAELRVDGGMSKNDFLMQFQADVLEADVVRSEIVEATALGVAMCAGISVGFFSSQRDACALQRRTGDTFKPSQDVGKVAQLKEEWEHAITQSQV